MALCTAWPTTSPVRWRGTLGGRRRQARIAACAIESVSYGPNSFASARSATTRSKRENGGPKKGQSRRRGSSRRRWTISPQRRRDPISAGGRLGNAWNNTPDCCGLVGTPCRRRIPRSHRSSEPCVLGAVVPRLRFPVVVSPVRGRWRAPDAQRSDRSCEGAARASIHPRSHRRARSGHLGFDCTDAAVDQLTCRCWWPYDVPDRDDSMRMDSFELTLVGGELARNGNG